MRILKSFWTLLVGVKDALVLLAMLLLFGLLYAALSFHPSARPGAAAGALLLDLDGALVEQPTQASALAYAAGNVGPGHDQRLRDVVRALKLAAGDPGIKAVALDLDRFDGGGQAAIATVGEALDAVRRARKPVIAYAGSYSDDGYQLASHASEIWLAPLGAVMVTGPGGSQLYMKGLLDRLGVTAHVYRVGTYKAAVEPLIRSDQSPAARAAAQALYGALWQSWQDEVRRARPQAQIAAYVADPVKALASAGADSAQAALRARLVDHVGTRAAFEARVAGIAGATAANDPAGFQAVSADRLLAAHPLGSGAAVGVLTVAGDIVDGTAPPGTAGGQDIADRLHDELARRRLKALVVRVDSPGGSVTGSETIRNAIMEARRQKLPVVISMGSVAASGGYWLSTAGDRILAEPTTITGSIGVFGVIPTFEKGLAKIGVTADGVRATPFAGQPDPIAGTSPEVDRLIQLGVEGTYGRFLGLVSAARRLPVARVDQIAQGRVWDGGTARQLGLVDGFGSLDDAIALAAKMAGQKPETARPIYIERAPSRLTQLLAGLMEDDTAIEGNDAWARLAARPDRVLAQALHETRLIVSGPVLQARCLECGARAGTRAAPEDAGFARMLLARIGL